MREGTPDGALETTPMDAGEAKYEAVFPSPAQKVFAPC